MVEGGIKPCPAERRGVIFAANAESNWALYLRGLTLAATAAYDFDICKYQESRSG